MRTYFENRPEKTITEGYGSYRLEIRYMANSNTAQVTMKDVAESRFPTIWSQTMKDDQANAALEIFKSIGYFDIA